jgi:hypothetical protein
MGNYPYATTAANPVLEAAVNWRHAMMGLDRRIDEDVDVEALADMLTVACLALLDATAAFEVAIATPQGERPVSAGNGSGG